MCSKLQLTIFLYMKKHVLEVYLSMRHKKGSNCVVRFGSNFDSVISLWKKKRKQDKKER